MLMKMHESLFSGSHLNSTNYANIVAKPFDVDGRQSSGCSSPVLVRVVNTCVSMPAVAPFRKVLLASYALNVHAKFCLNP